MGLKTQTLSIHKENISLFTGREEEVEYIINLIKNQQNCAITGSKGVGKTSFLNYINNKLQKDIDIIKINFPSIDLDYFVKVLLNKLMEKFTNSFDEEIKDRQTFTQKIETISKFLLKGEHVGEIQEQKVLNFVKSLVKNGGAVKQKLLSSHDYYEIIKKFLKNVDKKILISVDDMDKIKPQPETDNDKIYNFLMEIYDLLHIENIVWLFSINYSLKKNIEKEVLRDSGPNILSLLNDIVVLDYFELTKFKELIKKRIDNLNNYFTNSALRLLVSLSKGNPRIIIYLLNKYLKLKKIKKNDIISCDIIIESLQKNLSLDEKSIALLKVAAKKPYVTSSDTELKEAASLDAVSIGLRLKELVNKKFLASDRKNKKKIYWLSYIHDENIIS